MRKILLLLFWCSICLSQEEWRPLGPNDFNQVTFDYAGLLNGVVDSDGNYYVIHRDETNNSELTVRYYDGANWSQIGDINVSIGLTTKAAIAIDNNNIVYIAFHDYITTSTKIKRFVNGSWESLTSINTYAGNLSIGFNQNNDLYILYSDSSSENLFLKKYINSIWLNIGSSIGLVEGSINSPYANFCFDNNNVPYVVFNETSNNKITVKSFNGSQWITIGNPSFSENYTDSLDIGINTVNEPVVVYTTYDTINSTTTTKVKKFSSNSWIDAGINSFTEELCSTSLLKISNTGQIYVVFYSSQSIRIYKLEGNTWQPLENINYLKGSPRALLFNNLNEPVILYVDGYRSSKASLKKYQDSNWIDIGTTGISRGNTNSISFFVKNNVQYIAYNEVENLNKITVKKFINSSWETVGSSGFTGANAQQISMVVDSNENIFVAYQDYTNNYKINVKKFDGVSWTDLGVVSNFNDQYSKNPKLQFDNFENLYIVYDDIHNSAVIKKYINSTWQQLTNPDLSYNYENCNIIFDNNNDLIFAFRNFSNNQVIIGKYSNSNWQNIGTFSNIVNQYQMIQIDKDSSNNIYFSYKNQPDQNVCIKKYDGTNWSIFTNSQFSPNYCQNHTFVVKDDSFYVLFTELDNSLSYIDETRLTLKKLNQQYNWENVGQNLFTAGYSFYPLLCFQNDTPLAGYSSNGVFVKYFGNENSLNNNNQNLFSDNEIVVYPNPVVKSFSLLNSTEFINEVKIYNLDGALVFKSNDNSNNYLIDFLQSGVYLLKVKTPYKELTTKIIKN